MYKEVEVCRKLLYCHSVTQNLIMEDEDDCPELVPISTQPAPPAQQIPVTIITGYLGEIHFFMASMSLERTKNSGKPNGHSHRLI